MIQRPAVQWTEGEYTISTDRRRLDLDVIHGFLTTSYWAAGRSRERVAESISRSLCFGLYHGDAQIGFARVVTDQVVIAFLADVFVIDAYRGRGLGKWLIRTATSYDELKSVRRWLLGTRDAHTLYRSVGFRYPAAGRLLERVNLESDREPA